VRYGDRTIILDTQKNAVYTLDGNLAVRPRR